MSDSVISGEAFESSAFRIFDANANRAGEGLRVVEDYLRFHVQDAFLSQMCKQIRHDVSKTLVALDAEKRLVCRSAETDVGASVQTEAEYKRPSIRDVAIANLRRATEALRTLEEFAKLHSKQCAKEIESIRYRTYTLEKAITHLLRGRHLLRESRLYVLVDLRFGIEGDFQRRVRSLIENGVDVIQLRAKQKCDREVVAAARTLRKLTAGTDTALIVNDRPDIARLVLADGVHVGQDELSVAEARTIVGPDPLVGVSTHSVEQARQAVIDGADYIGIGPVFESRTKSFDQFVGLDLVRDVVGEIGIPVFPIGGITTDRVEGLRTVGATRVAVSSGIWLAEKPATAAGQFRSRLE